MRSEPLVIRSISERTGPTPLLVLAPLAAEGPRGRVLVKCEHLSPTGSVKDRIAGALLDALEEQAPLTPGARVIVASAGNLGIALALLARVRAIQLTVVLPDSMSLERRQLLASYGAELVLSPAEAQLQGAADQARALAHAQPGARLLLAHEHAAAEQAYERSLAKEILEQLSGERIDAFVAPIGTGALLSSVGRALRRHQPEIEVIGVEPSACATASGAPPGPSKLMELCWGGAPPRLDRGVCNQIRGVSDARAFAHQTDLAHRRGLLVGISSGACVSVAEDVARELGPTALVVSLLCDTGERYFSLRDHFQPEAST